MSADAPRDPLDQIIVDFPTAASLRPTPTVRFASSPPVLPIRSALATATITQQDDFLWYSRTDIATMRQQRRSDAATLRRTLLVPPDAILENGGVHVSLAVGLEDALNLTEARNNRRNVVRHRVVVLRLQDVANDDELRRISERLSSRSSERAHTLARDWINLG